MAAVLALVLALKTKEFHSNFLNIFVNSLILTMIHEVAGFVQAFVEVTGQAQKLHIVITVCLWVRNYHICTIVITNSVWVMERMFATYKIYDYETKKYIFISVFCLAEIQLSSMIWVYIWSTDVFPIDSMIALAVLSHLFPLITIYFVHKLNKKLDEKRLSEYCYVSYSLSQRFQLEENLRTITFVRNVFLFTLAFDYPIMGFIYIYNKAETEADRCFWSMFVDGFCLTYAFFYPLLYVVSSPKCRDFLQFYYNRHFQRPRTADLEYVVSVDKRVMCQIEQDNHFAFLQQIWGENPRNDKK
ncbi:unnamed protein product, partial [Mesorhabditis belari]|uniref:Uncharacterized protein n=1 Tax=Mesorhabditis belari TaxID=2138241 RepID=A0AAF3F7A9_9BILA